MISKEQVQHVAKLARIDLEQSEVEKFQKDLGAILEYFEMLNTIDVSGVAPMTHSVVLENRTRIDKVIPRPKAKAAALIEMAPNKKNGFVKVNSIL